MAKNYSGDPDVMIGPAVKAPTAAAVKLGDLLALCIRYWYWILFSLVICVFFAWYSTARTNPQYRQTMSVLLRDDAQGSGLGGASINLDELGLTKTYTVLEDEIEALRSPDLMRQVVQDLNLSTLYTSPQGLHLRALYGNTLPIKVSFPDMMPEDEASLTVKVSAEGKITVENLVVNEEHYAVNPEATIEFGDAINTPSGRVIIQRTPFLNEEENYEVRVNHMSIENAVAHFGGELNVDHSANKRSNVIDMAVIDTNRERAAEILVTLVKCYNENWLAGKAEVVAATNDFIVQRLAVLEDELSDVDASISAYKSANLIPDVRTSTTMAMQQSTEAENKINDLKSQLYVSRDLKEEVLEQDNAHTLPVNLGLSNQVESQINKYNELVLKRNAMIRNSSDANPLVIEYDSQLAALRGSILSSIENSIKTLEANIATLQRHEQANTAKVEASPQQARILLSAERKQSVQENLYLYLLQKREENELSQTLVNVNTRILRQPSGSKKPVTPKKAQTYILAFVIGLVIPVGSLYLLEMNNSTVRGRKDLQDMAVPVVGEIPGIKNSTKKKRKDLDGTKVKKSGPLADIVVENGNRNVINEAIRVLRSNLTRMTASTPNAVIMVTSFNPGSGKTFLTMNLGVSLALRHYKVLVIDGDLRRASLSKFAGSPRKGVADYLTGVTNNVDDVIVKNCGADGLDLLPVGTIPPNPTELLESERFTEMVKHLRTEYDYVFIDCPPAEMMADAQIIGEVCDRTIFVIRVGLFQRSMLNEVDRLYQEKKYPNMMVVLNDAITSGRYGYSYSYSYSYGYGYSRKLGGDKHYTYK